MTLYLLGAPGDLGGANTEAWHTLKLWRTLGLDVVVIPTWSIEPTWRQKLLELGCTVSDATPQTLKEVPGLAGSIVVGMCNSEFINSIGTLRAFDCRLVWLNCMTFLFESERRAFADHGPAEAYVFQSQFQRQELEPSLLALGYQRESGHLIRGAFDCSEWTFAPRPHAQSEPFVVGRMARPDTDKWSSNTWPIYSAIQYGNKRALMLGMDERTHAKLGAAPLFADCLRPQALSVPQFLASLHCLLPINGGARENWPRAGLEAMAAGVPIVAQNAWGWPEMLEHGVTGFLANDDCELAHYAALLAHDEDLRQRVIQSAHDRLVFELADPRRIWSGWRDVLTSLGASLSDVPGIPHAHTYANTVGELELCS